MIQSVTSPWESWRALELSVRMWPRSHLSVDLRERAGARTAGCGPGSLHHPPGGPVHTTRSWNSRWKSLPGLRRAKTSAMHLRGTEVVITVRYPIFRRGINSSGQTAPVTLGYLRESRYPGTAYLVIRVKGTDNSRSAASMRVSWAVGVFSR